MNTRILWICILLVILQGCQHTQLVSTPTVTPTVQHSLPSTSTPPRPTPTNTKTPTPSQTPTPQPTTPQWYLERINARQSWNANTNPVRVAIIDTGIDPNHEDLTSRIVGMIDVFAAPSMRDQQGHGTHTAGIIAAQPNHQMHTRGICQICQIVAIKAINDDGYGSDVTVAQGIDHAIDAGVVVINLSVGSGNDTPAIRSAIERALAADIVVVAAAGNTTPSSAEHIFPAAYPGVIAVSAVDKSNQIAPFARSGPSTDLVAPGVDIFNTSPFGAGYSLEQGTSTAAPQVSATVGLMRAIRPDLSAQQIQEILIAHAVDLGPAGLDDIYGYGLLDVDAAINALTTLDITRRGYIRGRIIGADASHVTVTLDAQRMQLDQNAQFGRSNLDAGTYTLAVGYADQHQSIELPITGVGVYVTDINVWIRNGVMTLEAREQLP